ncbi:class I SAM-dependent methyltransferase [Zavarzinia compransoris]|uniref:Nicotinamide N-methylase n=1 Tax=Zavarzinia compransoris TaxID=1264899 RepID=A0A317E8J9_9PROT|nr:50S ribosomal protein L11 methyltransferase [Zavarzinia compransoris]PWR23488.1 nicotinamide N-methylase [Zavarzinia compransoris]TDP45930.1 putative nicotinamide N-methyase [Zavarzinia compransoris]
MDLAPINDRRRFIVENTDVLTPPHTPEIRLHLASEALDLWQRTEDELGRLGLPPPFWAFAWAGGQALARYILDHPDLVRGRRVFDFAAGSGIVAIAALMAGAAGAEANEIDDFALAALPLNAALNDVTLAACPGDVIGRLDLEADIVFAGDVCYERPMAERVTDWLAALAAAGKEVLIGDPGRSYLARERLRKVAEYEVPVSRALEDAEVKRTAVWRFAGA